MLGCVEDQWPRLYQVFLSILTVIFFNNQTHAAYSPAMSVFHYGMFEVKLMNNIYIAIFFHPALGKGWLFSFIFSIHRFWLVIQSALRGVIRLLYTHCFCLFGIFHPFYWNHHFGIQSDEICTLLTKRIAYTFKWSYGILDTGQFYWMLDSVHDTCESKTWVPNVCPKIHPACGPLQNMQASSALEHCVSVIIIMHPSPLNTAFSFSCTWPWLRAANTFAFLWINMQMDILQTSTRGIAYVRRTANRHYIVEVIHRQKPPSFNMPVQVSPISSLPSTNHIVYFFLCLKLMSFWSIETIKNTHNLWWTNKEPSTCPLDRVQTQLSKNWKGWKITIYK